MRTPLIGRKDALQLDAPDDAPSGAADASAAEIPLAPPDVGESTGRVPAKSRFSLMPGFVRKSITPVLAGAALLLAGCATSAQADPVHSPGIDDTIAYADTTKTASVEPAPTGHFSDGPAPGMAAYRYQSNRLRGMLARGDINLHQFQEAHKKLVSGLLLGTETVPRDWRGRIDLDTIIYGTKKTSDKSRGQQALERFTGELEARMRVTARDMAYFEQTPFMTEERADGQIIQRYDFKEIDPDVLRKMITRTLRRIPLDELPIGSQLYSAITRLPGSDDVTMKMTFDEISRSVGDGSRVAFEAKFGDFIDDHKISVGLAVFGATTGLRYSSPEFAEVMDAFRPRFEVWSDHSADGSYGARARLAYRDAHVLPQLDLTGTAGTTLGRWDVRAMGTLTVAPEDAEHPLQGTVGVNAGLNDENNILDLNASYNLERDRALAGGTLYRYHPDWDVATSTTFTAMTKDELDEHTDPRLQLQFDLSKPLNFDRSSGHLGLYGGYGIDVDGSDDDLRLGVFFRLDF